MMSDIILYKCTRRKSSLVKIKNVENKRIKIEGSKQYHDMPERMRFEILKDYNKEIQLPNQIFLGTCSLGISRCKNTIQWHMPSMSEGTQINTK